MNNKNAQFLSFSFLLFVLSILISPRATYASTIVDQDITANTTWTALGSPYLISADVTVEDFTTLTIEPGVVVKFDYGYNIYVDGSVDAVGSTANPITITSIADDTIGGDSNNDGNLSEPSQGDYGGFVFSFFSSGDFAYTNFKYGFTSIAGSPDDLTLNNSTFTYNYLPLLIDYATNFLHENNSYTNNDLNGIGLSGVSFMQDVYLTGDDGTYLIFDDLTIDNGYTLVLNAGTVLKTGDDYSNISIDIYGQMVSLGTQSNTVCITSIVDDSCGGDTQGDGPAPNPSLGGFYDIYFNSINQTNSIINYTDIKYIKGGGGMYVDGAQLSVDHSNFIGKYSTIYFYQSVGNEITDSHFEDLWNTAVDISFDSTASITNTIFDMNGNNVTAIDIYHNSYLEIYNSSISNAQNGITVNNNSDMLVEDTVIDSMTNTGVYLYNNSNTNVPMVSIKNSEIKNCGTGLYVSDFVDVTFEFNKVNGNTFGVYNASINDLEMINNWWGSDTGPTHASNPGGTGDVVSDHIFFDPWTILNPTPATYYAKITNAPGDLGKMYETPTTSGVLIKTLPNDWVVHVVDIFENSPEIADGYMWYKIVDPTDGSEGYMIASPDTSTIPTFLSYEASEQVNYEYISSFKFDAPANGNTNDPDFLIHRRQAVLDAVSHYWGDNSIAPSLYSTDDHSSLLVSDLVNSGFPSDLFLAIAAQESGFTSTSHSIWDNEHVSFDYGHGIMQITPDIHETPPYTYLDNKVDPRGKISDIKLKKCKEIQSNEYQNCYKNVGTNKLKPYDNYMHNLQNIVFKQYANTKQSIYANIKDGLGVLREKFGNVYQHPCAGSVSLGGYTFTCDDIKRIKAVWGYNGAVFDPAKIYMKDVSEKLAALSTYFPGYTYANTDQLIEKLVYANAHRKEIKVHSPVELDVVDSQGNHTGINNGNIINNIPNSYYDHEKETTLVLFPDDTYTYKVIGDGTGATYGFDVITQNNSNNPSETFQASSVPIDDGEIHTYHIDETVLQNGGNGTSIDIDEDGDGTPEQTIVTGGTYDLTPPVIDFSSLLPEYKVGVNLNLVPFVTDDISDIPNITITADIDNLPQTITGNKVRLPLIGEHLLTIHAQDEAGNIATLSANIKTKYDYLQKFPLENDIINLSGKVNVKFILKGAPSFPLVSLPEAHPTIIFTRSSDNFIFNPVCNLTQTCFVRLDNQYKFSRLASKLGIGNWEMKINLDDGKEYITNIIIN